MEPFSSLHITSTELEIPLGSSANRSKQQSRRHRKHNFHLYHIIHLPPLLSPRHITRAGHKWGSEWVRLMRDHISSSEGAECTL